MLQFKNLIWKILSKTACPKDLLNWTGLEVVYHTKPSESKNTLNHFFYSLSWQKFPLDPQKFPLNPMFSCNSCLKEREQRQLKIKIFKSTLYHIFGYKRPEEKYKIIFIIVLVGSMQVIKPYQNLGGQWEKQ